MGDPHHRGQQHRPAPHQASVTERNGRRDEPPFRTGTSPIASWRGAECCGILLLFRVVAAPLYFF
eukprot:7607681-Pyramimonas_sp.AAC.1